MSPNPPDRPSTEELSALYWDRSNKIPDLNKRFGLRINEIQRLVTPKPVERTCPHCQGTLGFRTRGAEDRREAHCPSCGHEEREYGCRCSGCAAVEEATRVAEEQERERRRTAWQREYGTGDYDPEFSE